MKNEDTSNLLHIRNYIDVPLPEGFEWDFKLNDDEQGVNALTTSVWPSYLTEKPDIEITIPYQKSQYERYLKERFFTWGIRQKKDNLLVAFVSGRSLFSESGQTQFNHRGWQWSLDASLDDEQVNTLCLTSATVSPKFRSQGFAKLLIVSAKQLACQIGFHSVIVPVRPTNKINYPTLSMKDYIALHLNQDILEADESNIDGSKVDEQKFDKQKDPWITLHQQQGASLLNICEYSMVIKASLSWWEKQTNIPLENLEKTDIPFGIAPLKIEQKQFLATYTEPNVWMKYSV